MHDCVFFSQFNNIYQNKTRKAKILRYFYHILANTSCIYTYFIKIIEFHWNRSVELLCFKIIATVYILYTCLALWKHHVNLLLQSFRSVSSAQSVLIIRRRFELTDQKLCNNKFTWCFHIAKQVYSIHHANVQETYLYIYYFSK